jgi:glutamine amidotransferase-like uncharacterized protein
MRQTLAAFAALGVLSAAGCVDHLTEAQPPDGTAVSPPRSTAPRSVLIYSGESAWWPEIRSLEALLWAHGTKVFEADSKQFERITLEELSKYALLIFPGGDAIVMTKSLSAATHAKLREAVQTRGVSYLGFCAGAWIAIAPAPPPGEDVEYGLGLVDGPVQKENYLAKRGDHFAMTLAMFPDGSRHDLLWYGGPITPEIPGGVVARYPDGTPAITQIQSGSGFVIVSGLHPAATPEVLLDLGLTDTDGPDYELAWRLLEAALSHQPLPAF